MLKMLYVIVYLFLFLAKERDRTCSSTPVLWTQGVQIFSTVISSLFILGREAVSVLGQMEALLGNQERRSLLGSGGFKIRLDMKPRGRIVFGNQTSISWNHISNSESTLCPCHRAEAETLEVVSYPGYIDNKDRVNLGHLTVPYITDILLSVQGS